jgi:hypothetical protein
MNLKDGPKWRRQGRERPIGLVIRTIPEIVYGCE